jgi:hypothetical protein
MLYLSAAAVALALQMGPGVAAEEWSTEDQTAFDLMQARKEASNAQKRLTRMKNKVSIRSEDGVVAMRMAQNVEFDLVASDVLPELKTSVRDIFDRIVAEGEARSNETEKLEQRLHDQEQSTDAGFTNLSQSVETEMEKLALETREQITSVEAAGNATFASLTKAVDDLTTSLAAVSDEVKNEIMPDVNKKIGVVQESLKAVKATAEGAADKVKIFAPAANLVSKGEIEFPEKPFITIEIKNPLAGGVDLEVAYGTASAVQQNKWSAT